MIRPYTPDEALGKRKDVIPEVVIDVVNHLLARKFDGASATLSQKEIEEMIMQRMPPEFKRITMFEQNWLDFEPVYREAGWDVVYDKPGYNESYNASFVFTRKSK